jgi:hypothetical protein
MTATIRNWERPAWSLKIAQARGDMGHTQLSMATLLNVPPHLFREAELGRFILPKATVSLWKETLGLPRLHVPYEGMPDGYGNPKPSVLRPKKGAKKEGAKKEGAKKEGAKKEAGSPVDARTQAALKAGPKPDTLKAALKPLKALADLEALIGRPAPAPAPVKERDKLEGHTPRTLGIMRLANLIYNSRLRDEEIHGLIPVVATEIDRIVLSEIDNFSKF